MQHSNKYSTSAASGEAGGANDYDSFAAAYAADNEVNLSNAHYERPAVLALAGEVAGRRVLDAGCGSGSLTAALRERGAVVTGTDSGAGMLALAARRLGSPAAHPSPVHGPRTGRRCQLLRDLQHHRGVDQARADRGDELLAPPLHAMTDAFTAAGFGIDVISEPQPVPAARDLSRPRTSPSSPPSRGSFSLCCQHASGRAPCGRLDV